MKPTHSTEKSVLLDIAPESLWRILTEPKFTKAYMFNCSVQSKWEKGSPIIWKGNYEGYEAYQKGEILEIEPFKTIRYSTFDPNFGLEDKPENYIHVCYLIQKEGAQSRLRVINETFDGNMERMQHIEAGWDIVMPKIHETVEKASLKMNKREKND